MASSPRPCELPVSTVGPQEIIRFDLFPGFEVQHDAIVLRFDAVVFLIMPNHDALITQVIRERIDDFVVLEEQRHPVSASSSGDCRRPRAPGRDAAALETTLFNDLSSMRSRCVIRRIQRF